MFKRIHIKVQWNKVMDVDAKINQYRTNPQFTVHAQVGREFILTDN